MENKAFDLLPIKPAKEGKLQFSPITINADYRKKWNIYCNDFICLIVSVE